MKEYIFTRKNNEMRIETDGFGEIEGFIVTGVFGNQVKDLVHDGLDLRMGQSVTTSQMQNLAKTLKSKITVYDCGKVVEEETVDYTEPNAE